MLRTIQDVMEEVQHLNLCIEVAEEVLEHVDKIARRDDENREVYASISEHLLAYVDEKGARREKLMCAPFGDIDDHKEKKKHKDKQPKKDKSRKTRKKSQ